MTEHPNEHTTNQPQSGPQSGPPIPTDLAGFWPRAGALILDRILYGLVAAPFVIGGVVLMCAQLDFNGRGEDPTFDGNGGLFALGILLAIAGVVLSVVLYLYALATSGRPWGSRIVGLQVVNREGEAPGWGAALLRSVTAVIAMGAKGVIGVIGYLWMLGNDEHQTWFDKISRTYVRRVI